MDSLTTLCRNIDVEAAGHNTPMHVFPMLKRMELMFLPELERWSENSAGEINRSVMFPRLEKLTIWNCDKLASLPGTSVLTRLYLCDSRGASGSMCMPLDCFSSLVRLEITLLLVDVDASRRPAKSESKTSRHSAIFEA